MLSLYAAEEINQIGFFSEKYVKKVKESILLYSQGALQVFFTLDKHVVVHFMDLDLMVGQLWCTQRKL